MYATSARTPYNQLPITIINKAMRQKVYRNLHCIECGLPIAQITDKVVMMYDGNTELQQMLPSVMGIVDIRCDRRGCNQFYRMEFSV